MISISKYVDSCTRAGRSIQPALSSVLATANGLSLRFSFRGLPFVLVTTAIVLSIISCHETGILTGNNLAETPFTTYTPDKDLSPSTSLPENDIYTPQFYSLSVQSSQELINQLKDFKLWSDIQTEVPSVILNNFPADLKQIDVDVKKKTFVRSLLPTVILVQNEVRQERQELLKIIDEIGDPSELKFAINHPGWQEGISQAQILFINNLCKKYRTNEATELLTRVNVLPTSLMLAQAAIESSWGSSRFSLQANNLFGMWTWGKKGLIPAHREAGKSHKIAIYDSIADSVRSYLLTINRLGAYSDLREIRNKTMDSEAIADGLINYSQRKEYYVLSLKKLMRHNNLTDYDKCRLAPPINFKGSVRA